MPSDGQTWCFGPGLQSPERFMLVQSLQTVGWAAVFMHLQGGKAAREG